MSYKLWMFSIIDVSSEKNNLYEMFWTVGLGLKQVSSPRDFCQTRTNYLGHKALLDLIWVTCPRFHVTQRVNNWEYKTKFIDSYSKQIKASLWSFFVNSLFQTSHGNSKFWHARFFLYTQCTLLLVFSLIYNDASQLITRTFTSSTHGLESKDQTTLSGLKTFWRHWLEPTTLLRP